MVRSRTRRFAIWFFIGLSAAAILYSLEQILGKEAFRWMINQSEYKTMMAETALLFAAFCLSGLFIPGNRKKLGVAILITSIFLWAHQAFVPVAVTGGYLFGILAIGRLIRVKLFGLPKRDGIAVDFLTGASVVLSLFCLLSALGIGSILWLRGFTIAGGIFLILFGRSVFRSEGAKKTVAFTTSEIVLLAFILTMICMQAGRLNIAVDYDSLWYGVRSQYILNNGHGIYENLGTIGIVYTYSKGFEVLTLPLADLPSYSFVTAVNLWLSAGVLYMGYQLGRFYLKREQSVFLTALLSATPGIMNMAVTAKSDMITLLFQAILLFCFLCYLKKGTSSYRFLVYGVAAYLISLTLKPTALIFSTAVFGMACLYILVKLLTPKLGKETGNGGSIFVFLSAAAALLGIWGRTVKLTGLPVTSVFSSFLVKLGFQLKYPFRINHIPNCNVGLSQKERVLGFINRLYGFFLSPMEPEMDHVIIAWGGYLLFFLLLLWIVAQICGKHVDKGEKKHVSDFLGFVYVPFLIVNFIGLAMLSQVDGNYFMLLYLLTTIYVLKTAAQVPGKIVWNSALGAGAFLLIFSVFLTALTNWGWSVGYSPVSFRHKGYYNHIEETRSKMEEKGNNRIWERIASNPQTRMIAIGSHPEVLSFPCNVQSYDDITGVWGNVELVKKMDYFVDFMEYAKTDFVYVQTGYIEEKDRPYTLVRDLIEGGKLVPVCYENGNLLAKVDLKGKYSHKSQQALTEFKQCYIKKETKETKEGN